MEIHDLHLFSLPVFIHQPSLLGKYSSQPFTANTEFNPNCCQNQSLSGLYWQIVNMEVIRPARAREWSITWNLHVGTICLDKDIGIEITLIPIYSKTYDPKCYSLAIWRNLNFISKFNTLYIEWFIIHMIENVNEDFYQLQV